MFPMLKPIEFTLVLCTVLLHDIKSNRADSIPLTPRGGVFTVPVQIDGKITRDFIVDSGASVILLPDEVYRSLTGGAEAKPEAFQGTATLTWPMANGAKIKARRVVLRSVTVGDATVYNVLADIAPVSIPPVLGQSFLARLPSWTVDNGKHTLFIDTKIWHTP